jgi:hypothetical protein
LAAQLLEFGLEVSGHVYKRRCKSFDTKLNGRDVKQS